MYGCGTQKKLKRKSPYIEDKKKKKGVQKPWISCGCHEKLREILIT